MIQTLYLDGRREAITVELYGVALRISRAGSVAGLAPLGRVRRICCWGRVQWAGEALIACAASAVPIGFLARGRSVAWFLPTRPPAKAFGALIEEATLNPKWPARLQNWVDSEQALALTAAVASGGETWRAVRPFLALGDTRGALRVGVRLPGRAGQPRRVWRHLRQYLHLWVVERLQAEDLSLACFGFSSDKPNLPDHFTRALAPLLLPALRHQCEREISRGSGQGAVDGSGAGGLASRCALAFDHEDPRLTAWMKGALRRFERMIRDCAEDLEPWPGF